MIFRVMHCPRRTWLPMRDCAKREDADALAAEQIAKGIPAYVAEVEGKPPHARGGKRTAAQARNLTDEIRSLYRDDKRRFR